MKRNLARDVNKRNIEVNEKSETSTTIQSNIADKILDNHDLSLEDIVQLGQVMAQQQGYDTNQLVICNIPELNEHLIRHKDDAIDKKPILIICNDETNGKSVFCIVKFLEKIICLYKDFLNIYIPENIRNILEQNFSENIEFKVHSDSEKTKDMKDNGEFALKTLETMMVCLKPDKIKDFIENFTDPKKTYFGWLADGVVGLKNQLFNLVKDGYYKTVTSDVDQLSRNEDFKTAIQKLINSIPSMEVVSLFQNYQTLLKELVTIEDSENNTSDISSKIDELEKAKNSAFSKSKEINIESSKNENGDLKLDIDRRFPTEIEQFNRIFKPLTTSNVDANFDKILNDICIKLGLEYNRLKSFFPVKVEEKQNANYKPTNIINIKKVISGLPKFQCKGADARDKDNKPLDQLLSDMQTLDSLESLRQGYDKIKGYHKLWDQKDALAINKWAVSKKGHLDESEIHEAIAIMDTAFELVTGGHSLRDTQILSILSFLQTRHQGKLAQIQTGEGKTTIVSILAAIRALQGEPVDVITSNPVLASDGIKTNKQFYNMLNLSAATIDSDENYKSGEKECYKCDIVYGDIGSFQCDYLKDSFLGLDTRASRRFGSIVLDEVDSMIIDNASHIAKLAGPIPGMESLKYVYIKVWQELYKAEDKIIQEFQKKLKEKAQELYSQNLPDDESQALYDEFEDSLKDSIIFKLKDHIRSTNPTKIDFISSHIQEYADNSIDRWIDSAIDAKFNFHEDEQYIIRKNKDGEEVVQPVDYANTGITLKNTIWQHGLHQFLQLKHNLHLTSESLTSCYISNLGFIKKYGDNIFGLTGTLGSEAEQKLLSSIYNVSFTKIPTYKEKKFIEIDGAVVDNEVFSEEVAADAVSEVEKGRSCLIICETIKVAKTIEEILKKRDKVKIKTFFDEEDANITEGELKHGVVVIATNIAGRGTDFKTSAELENNGGLHVSVAFLPCNKRVEDQAFGRTSRQGNHGTAKLIINRSEIRNTGIGSDNLSEIKRARDLKEQERIEQIRELQILEINFQDELFEQFSALYRKLKSGLAGENQYALDDLKEFWAFWLEKNKVKGIGLADKSTEIEFQNFKSEARESIGGKITFNPYYSIKQADYFIMKEQFDKAEEALKHAINITKNPEILHGAYIKLFEVAIERGWVLMDKFKKAVGDVFIIPAFIPGMEPDRKYKDNAIYYLKKAKEALQIEEDYIKRLLGDEEIENIVQGSNSLLIKHIVSKQTAVSLYIQHADKLIKQIREHKAGIFISGRTPNYFSTLKPQSDDEQKIKSTVSNSELSELADIGTHTTYALKEMHDICPEIVTGAQIQIRGGIELIFAGCCFPPALPVTTSIGGTMITEGLCDIVIELINNNSDPTFNKAAYIKGKVISYGISLLTLGISAALQCPKILSKAKAACRWLSDTLRKCPYLKSVCEYMATKIDKLGSWFEKLETIAKFNKMSKVEKLKYASDLEKTKNLKELKYLGNHIKQFKDLTQELQKFGILKELTHFEKCISAVKQVVVSTTINVVKRVAENVIMGKVVTPALSSAMKELHPTIRKHVDKSVKETLNQDKLQYNSYKDIQIIIKEIRESIDLETIRDIFKDTILGLTKYCSNWRIQLGALAIDQFDSWYKVYDYSNDLCIKINDKLKSTGEPKPLDVKDVMDQIIEQITEELFSKVVSNTIKTFKDCYSVGKSAYKNRAKEKKEVAKCLEQNRVFKEGGEAGQEQAHALSDVVKRKIIIHADGQEIVKGEQYRVKGDPIEVDYYPPDEYNPHGHYVPRGKDRNWSLIGSGNNNCLFDAVGSQIGKDPSNLRKETENQMDSDPTRYIASNVRGQFSNDIFLEGGKKTKKNRKSKKHRNSKEPQSSEKHRRPHQRLTDDFYPSLNKKIKLGGKVQRKVVAKFGNFLVKKLEKAKQFDGMKQGKILTYIKYRNKSIPQFGSVPGKEEMMMCVMSVKFDDGSKFEIITVSGNEPFGVRQSVSTDKNFTTNTETIPLKYSDGDYNFEDQGKPKGPIYDVINRRETNKEYTKSCAAQKAMYCLSKHLKSKQGLRIKGDIHMTEAWFESGNDKGSDQVIPEKSCTKCEDVLPTATGKR